MVKYLRINNLTDKDLTLLSIKVLANSSLTVYDESYNLENDDYNYNIATFKEIVYSKSLYTYISTYCNDGYLSFEEEEDDVVKLIDRFEFWEDASLTYIALKIGITSITNHYDVDFPKIASNNGKSLVFSDQEKTFIAAYGGGSGGTNDHTYLINIGDYTHFEIDDHIENTGNPHEVSKLQLGLENVDNTSDIDKPISTLVQEQFDIINDNPYVHPTGDGFLHVPANGTTNEGNVLTAGAVAGVYSWEEPQGGSGGEVTTDNITIVNPNLQYIESDNLDIALGEIDFILANKIVFGEYTTNDVIEELSGDLYVFKEDKDASWYVRYVHEVDIENMEIRHATRFNNPTIITYDDAYDNYNILNYSFLSDAI